MKLYFATGTCSLAPHIALKEAGIAFETEKVDIRAKQYSGGDYREVNPKGSVPALRLDNGEILTENAAILQYIADMKPESGLAPRQGTWARVRLQEALNFVATEVHKSYGVMFAADRMVKNPEGNKELKSAMREALAAKYELASRSLANGDFLTGSNFTVADAYFYTVSRWAGMMEVDLSRFPAIQSYMKRVSERPAVRAALEGEGLKP